MKTPGWRLRKRHLHLHKATLLGIFHSLFEFLWHPRVILLDNKYRHCGPFAWRQQFDLLDYFLGAHADTYIGTEQGNSTREGG